MNPVLIFQAILLNSLKRFRTSSVITALCFSLAIGPIHIHQALGLSEDELRNLIFEPALIRPVLSQIEGQITANNNETLTHELTLPPPEGSNSSLQGSVQDQYYPDIELPEDSALASSIAQYEQSIIDFELEGGPYEAGLIEELMSLGTIYQQQGEHDKAIELFDRASHINRVNKGLFNLEQGPIIEKVINSYLAKGELIAADNQQEYLFYIQQRVYGTNSTQLLPALKTLAEWNIIAFTLRLGTNTAFSSESMAYTASPNRGIENFRIRRLVNAQNLYRAIIEIILINFGANDPRLLDAEKKLATTNYFYAINYDIRSTLFQNSGSQLSQSRSTVFGSSLLGYRSGREALERRINHLGNMPEASPDAVGKALIDLGDWHLIFKKRKSATDIYKQAYQEFISSGISAEATTEIMSPLIPVAVPTFIDQRFTTSADNLPGDEAVIYKGYIDVSFTLNRYGIPRQVTVLNRTENTAELIESRLIRNIQRTQFRPRLKAGEYQVNDPVQLRYYYTY